MPLRYFSLFILLISCNFFSLTQRGLSALFMACEVGDAATVEVILSFSPDMTIRDQVLLYFLLN